MKAYVVHVVVANGPSKKNVGVAKLSLNFTGFTVSFFSGYVCLAFCFSQLRV